MATSSASRRKRIAASIGLDLCPEVQKRQTQAALKRLQKRISQLDTAHANQV